MWPANWLAGLTTAWKIDSKQKVTIYWPCQKIMSAEILINEKVNLNDQFQLISIKILETMKITQIINKYDILQYFN